MKYKKVCVVGPAHRLFFKGIATHSADFFETPLGQVKIDHELAEKCQLQTLDEAFIQEHSIEVHLPFLQLCMGNFTFLPVLTGDASIEETRHLFNTLLQEENLLIIVSSDLSHFHPYDEAMTLDQETIEEILSMKTDLKGEQACGCRAINGLHKALNDRGIKSTLLHYSNSGDTGAGKENVVGYASFAYTDEN